MLYIRATRLSITIKEGINMTVLFLLYAGIIPAVPLIGAEIYKRRNDNTRRSVCYVLFFLQLILSACYVVEWFSR